MCEMEMNECLSVIVTDDDNYYRTTVILTSISTILKKY